MSIITEALKKAQEKRQVIAEPAGSPPANYEKEFLSVTPSGAARKRLSRTASIALAAMIVLLPLVIVISFLFFANSTPKTPQPALDSPALNDEAVQAVTVPEDPYLPAAASEPDLNDFRQLPALNGIMYSAVLPQAVINGTLVGEGEIIDGFSIRRIFPDRVELLSGGNEYELRMR